MPEPETQIPVLEIKSLLQSWAKELGFSDLRITDTDVSAYSERHNACIEQELHGEMDYLERNRELRYQPEKLLPGTRSIICVRMNCLPAVTTAERLQTKDRAYIARYALGRDYHKLMRKRLNTLARRLIERIGPIGYRAFVDSAPILERQLAEKSGLGWIGKNTLLLNEQAGSWFLLGEIYTDLALPADSTQASRQRCGNCTACLDVCPTKAFLKPWVLDARKCISYLTIEFKGSIPLPLRPLIGNRIFGCDDCQIFCPWTKFSETTVEPDFQPRHNLDNADLIELFLWTETEFLNKTAGSPIRRAGYECWLRNIAIALGNAPKSERIVTALMRRSEHPSALVREHVAWSLARQANQPD